MCALIVSIASIISIFKSVPHFLVLHFSQPWVLFLCIAYSHVDQTTYCSPQKLLFTYRYFRRCRLVSYSLFFILYTGTCPDRIKKLNLQNTVFNNLSIQGTSGTRLRLNNHAACSLSVSALCTLAKRIHKLSTKTCSRTSFAPSPFQNF